MNSKRVGLVGVGTIGRGWAALFARAGFDVALYDRSKAAVTAALDAIAVTLRDLEGFELVEDADEAHARLRISESVEDAVQADFVQESVPEQVSLKREMLALISGAAPRNAIISSSCSSLAPADIFSDVVGGERCIVAHPFNPPHLLPLVELLPSPHTSDETLERTKALLVQLGQVPVVIRKAVPGYVVNRLQAAVVNEAMQLVGDGVISPTDLDLCMTTSLGRRWSFLGPFATMDLNADDGIAGYARNFRESYEAIGSDLGAAKPWPDAAVSAVVQARRGQVPIEALKDAREDRDRRLMEFLITSGEPLATEPSLGRAQ